MERVVLGLGSNRSFNDISPIELLKEACVALSVFIKNANISSVYRTGAMYVTNQDDFYNMVLTGFYEGEPRELLDRIHEVEAELGRNRDNEFRNGPRSLDIDIELFGDRRIVEADLVIPHERMHERAFVLVPLIEVLRENADEIKGSHEMIDSLSKDFDANCNGQAIELYGKISFDCGRSE